MATLNEPYRRAWFNIMENVFGSLIMRTLELLASAKKTYMKHKLYHVKYAIKLSWFNLIKFGEDNMRNSPEACLKTFPI